MPLNVKVKVLVTQSCPSLCDLMDCLLGSSARLLCPWDSPGKNSGVGGHSFLQEIFQIQGSNPYLVHCRQTLPFEPPGKTELYLQGDVSAEVSWDHPF